VGYFGFLVMDKAIQAVTDSDIERDPLGVLDVCLGALRSLIASDDDADQLRAVRPTKIEILTWKELGLINYWDKKDGRYYMRDDVGLLDESSSLRQSIDLLNGSRTGLSGTSWYISESSGGFVFEKLKASPSNAEKFGIEDATAAELQAYASNLAHKLLADIAKQKMHKPKRQAEQANATPVRELSAGMQSLIDSGRFYLSKNGDKLVSVAPYIETEHYIFKSAAIDVSSRRSEFKYVSSKATGDDLVGAVEMQPARDEFVQWSKGVMADAATKEMAAEITPAGRENNVKTAIDPNYSPTDLPEISDKSDDVGIILDFSATASDDSSESKKARSAAKIKAGDWLINNISKKQLMPLRGANMGVGYLYDDEDMRVYQADDGSLVCYNELDMVLHTVKPSDPNFTLEFRNRLIKPISTKSPKKAPQDDGFLTALAAQRKGRESAAGVGDMSSEPINSVSAAQKGSGKLQKAYPDSMREFPIGWYDRLIVIGVDRFNDAEMEELIAASGLSEGEISDLSSQLYALGDDNYDEPSGMLVSDNLRGVESYLSFNSEAAADDAMQILLRLFGLGRGAASYAANGTLFDSFLADGILEHVHLDDVKIHPFANGSRERQPTAKTPLLLQQNRLGDLLLIAGVKRYEMALDADEDTLPAIILHTVEGYSDPVIKRVLNVYRGTIDPLVLMAEIEDAVVQKATKKVMFDSMIGDFETITNQDIQNDPLGVLEACLGVLSAGNERTHLVGKLKEMLLANKDMFEQAANRGNGIDTIADIWINNNSVINVIVNEAEKAKKPDYFYSLLSNDSELKGIIADAVNATRADTGDFEPAQSVVQKKLQTPEDLIPFPESDFAKAFSGMYRQTGQYAKQAHTNYIETIRAAEAKAMPHVENSEQQAAFDQAKAELMAEYIQKIKSVMSAASGVYSGHIAGWSKLNIKQVERRDSAYEKTTAPIYKWMSGFATEQIYYAVRAAMNPEQRQREADSNQAARDADMDKAAMQLWGLLDGVLPMKFAGDIVKSIGFSRDGLPSSLTIGGGWDPIKLESIYRKTPYTVEGLISHLKSKGFDVPTKASQIKKEGVAKAAKKTAINPDHKTITMDEWKRKGKDRKTIKDGQRFILGMTANGTGLIPVNVVKSLDGFDSIASELDTMTNQDIQNDPLGVLDVCLAELGRPTVINPTNHAATLSYAKKVLNTVAAGSSAAQKAQTLGYFKEMLTLMAKAGYSNKGLDELEEFAYFSTPNSLDETKVNGLTYADYEERGKDTHEIGNALYDDAVRYEEGIKQAAVALKGRADAGWREHVERVNLIVRQYKAINPSTPEDIALSEKLYAEYKILEKITWKKFKQPLEDDYRKEKDRMAEQLATHGQVFLDGLMQATAVDATTAKGWAEQQPISDDAAKHLKKLKYPIDQVRKDLAELYALTNGRISHVALDYVSGNRRAYTTESQNRVSSKTLQLGSDFDKQILFHEMGHHMESDKAALAASNGFLEAKRESDKLHRLEDLSLDSGYDKSELAYKGNFFNPYVGKYYADKTTEVWSMGLESFAMPSVLAQRIGQDPQMFAMIKGGIAAPKHPLAVVIEALATKTVDDVLQVKKEEIGRLTKMMKKITEVVRLTDDAAAASGGLAANQKRHPDMSYMGGYKGVSLFSAKVRNRKTKRVGKGFLVVHSREFNYAIAGAGFDNAEAAFVELARTVVKEGSYTLGKPNESNIEFVFRHLEKIQ
jgi:hypothetical protein